MSLDSAINSVTSRATTGAKNVWRESTQNRGSVASTLISAPGHTVASIGVESLRFGTGIVADVTKYTIGKMMNLGLSTAKLGLQSLTLIPLPMPWGNRSVAQYGGDIRAAKDAYQLKVSGSPEKFSDIVARLRGVRDNAQRQSTGTEQPALAA